MVNAAILVLVVFNVVLTELLTRVEALVRIGGTGV